MGIKLFKLGLRGCGDVKKLLKVAPNVLPALTITKTVVCQFVLSGSLRTYLSRDSPFP